MDRGWSEEKLESYAQSAFEELTEPGQISRRCPGCAGPTPPERTAPAQQATVLLPLRAAPRLDTRNLAKSLLRELRGPTEPGPADAPTGRGDESAPTA